jgi:hypothetical protein
MLPSDHEAKHLEHYLYRLHNDLQFRVGARAKKPGAMVPQAAAWAAKTRARAFSSEAEA